MLRVGKLRNFILSLAAQFIAVYYVGQILFSGSRSISSYTIVILSHAFIS